MIAAPQAGLRVPGLQQEQKRLFLPNSTESKEKGAVDSLSPFFLCFVTDQTLEVLFSVCFVFKKRKTISFVPATELLDSLTHLTSIYGVFTVYKLL